MSINAAIGLFFMGYNQGVFNVVQLAILNLNQVFSTGDVALYSALMTSAQALGGLIGAFTASYIISLFNGIRISFIVFDFLALISTIIIIIEHDFGNIILGRLLCGYIAGVNTALVPVYIKSFAPNELSGRLGTMSQLFQKSGLLISYLMGLALPTKADFHTMNDDNKVYDDEVTWKIVIGFPMIVVVIRMILFIF